MATLQQILANRQPRKLQPLYGGRQPPTPWPFMPAWASRPGPSLTDPWLYVNNTIPPIRAPAGTYPPGWGSSGWAWGQGAAQHYGGPHHFKPAVPQYPNFYPPWSATRSGYPPWKPEYFGANEV